MSGFGCAPLIVIPPEPAEMPVTNDGWFPDIDATRIRDEWRVRDVVTPDRLKRAIVGAIMTVGNQLTAWKVAHVLAGHASLAAVPSPKIDGTSRLVLLYARAIGASAKAELVETYRDMDLTGAGQRQVEDMEPSIVELRRDALHAVRDMLGRTRLRVELI